MIGSIISLFKRVFMFGIIGLLLLGLFSLSVFAEDMKDGSYTIDYTVKKAEDDSVSMANDYFEKPARVEIKNGQVTVEVTMNHSEWITEFKTPVGSGYADAKVIHTNTVQDKRTVRFLASSLGEPLLAKIHVTVSSIDYDHDYTVRFVLDNRKVRMVSATEDATPEPEKPAAAKKPSVTSSDKGEIEKNVDSGSTIKKPESNSPNNDKSKSKKKETSTSEEVTTTKKDTEDTRISVSTPTKKELEKEQNESSEKQEETSFKSVNGMTSEEKKENSGDKIREEKADVSSAKNKEEKTDDSGAKTEEVASLQESGVSEPNVINSTSQVHTAMNVAEEEQDQPMTSQPTGETGWYVVVAGIVLAAAAIGGAGWVVRKRRLAVKK